jgi:hypothetical protein
MSFMMKIDDARGAQHSPLDLLATEYSGHKSRTPSLDFCCRVAGVPDSDDAVARRLRVAVSTVRGWREIGRRAESNWTCR